MKKYFKFLFAVLAVATLSSCGVNGSGSGTGNGNGDGCEVCTGNEDLTLEQINNWFSPDVKNPDNAETEKWYNLRLNGNKVTLIPFTHINGPGYLWDFFAIVNYEFTQGLSYKYQVTYLSCTCRSPNVNYWQTMYVELSKNKNADNVVLEYLSFENDLDGHYIAGFWGDSGVNGYDIAGSGVTYEAIRDGFIPYLVGKTRAELKQFDKYSDINEDDFNAWATENNVEVSLLGSDDDGDGKPDSALEPKVVEYDDFNGASVSTNNLIRVINALMDYHATKM